MNKKKKVPSAQLNSQQQNTKLKDQIGLEVKNTTNPIDLALARDHLLSLSLRK